VTRHGRQGHSDADTASDAGLHRLVLLLPDGLRTVLSSTERTRVERVLLPDGRGTFICKQLMGPGAVARKRHEIGIIERLASVPGVSRLAEFTYPDALVLEDDRGSPLADALAAGRFDVAAVPALALELARIIGAVHGRGVVHKDINPANVLLTETGRPVLVDFDIANTFAEDWPGFVNHRDIVGTLRYLPPEQTGRTGFPVDHRADLYGLGSTLYELVCGHTPFELDDELRLIHDILLRVPEPLADLVPEIPPALSDIVARLLEKEPDRRYQSAEGVVHDLARLVESPAERFELGVYDFPLRLSAPSRLVGRDDETAAMRAAFEDSLVGGTRAVLVAGAPGVGKSALINDLRYPVGARNGWFVAGKSDQYQQDAALGSVQQALRVLGRLLLAEPEESLATVRGRLAEALMSNAALIMATLPEFAVLLGADDEVIVGDQAQAEVRLRQAVPALLRVVASAARPVVLVVDDLQWADPTSLGLFDAMLTEPDLPGLLVVGAFRAQEVDATHPLSAMLSRWQRLGAVEPPTMLENLPPANSSLLVADIVRLAPDRAAELGAVLHQWTAGNPYDTLELINALRRVDLLTLVDGGWSWDSAAVRDHVAQSDVPGILQDRISGLPTESRTLLHAMACLGGVLDVELLARAVEMSTTTALDHLLPPLEAGLLVMVDAGRPDDGAPRRVRFRHDRVQQAAFAVLGEADRSRLRLALARRLAESPDSKVEAAEQYLGAAGAVADPAEQRRVAVLYSNAADNAWRAANHLAAAHFLSAAADVLVALEVSDDDPEFLRVRVRLHAALYSLGRLEEADEVYAAIRESGPDPVDLAAVATIQLGSLAQRNRQREALTHGLQLLALLGQTLPGADYATQVPDLCRDVVAWADRLDLDGELRRPEITDPRMIATTRLFSRLSPIAFFLDEPMVGAWVMLQSWRLWVRHGASADLAATVSAVGVILVPVLDDYRTGYRVGRHVLAVSESRGYEPSTSLVRHRFSLQLLPWMEPLENSVHQARLAHEGLVRGGDLQMAGATHFTVLSGQLDCAGTVESYVADIEAAVAFATRSGNLFSGRAVTVHRQLARALLGLTNTLGSFDDDEFAQEDFLTQLGPTPFVLGMFHAGRSVGAAIFGDWPTLAHHTAAAMALRKSMVGNTIATVHFLRAVSLAEQARRLPEHSEALLAELDECQAWLVGRAAEAPSNFRHLLRAVEAERAWTAGDLAAALVAFDEAVGLADQQQRPWHRAFILERAAALQVTNGLRWMGRRLMAVARQGYVNWGASAKVAHMDVTHPFLRAGESEGLGEGRTGGTMGRTRNINADVIDTMAILRASQALSSATDLDKLQVAIVEQLTALTGAAEVLFVLRDDQSGEWFLPQNVQTGEPAMNLAQAGQRGLLPMTAFRYAERTREPLVVEDATRDDRLARDPYLAGAERCSLLVAPILHQDSARAMLVLANRQANGVFTADRLDAVMLISGQLVVSLGNALLYASMEQRVAQRTQELAVANAQLETLSTTDSLTGLANRRRLDQALDSEWLRAKRNGHSMAAVMIDVDFFKRYNDHYGHAAGDECLRQVAAVLAKGVRDGTDVACRYGGEEFVLLLGDTDNAGVQIVGERIRAAVEGLRIPHVGGLAGFVTISVGTTISLDPLVDSSQALLGRADAAMYEAKEAGRNRVRCASLDQPASAE
jgi:diguanylate cyclase (GGDEF)-like protein